MGKIITHHASGPPPTVTDLPNTPTPSKADAKADIESSIDLYLAAGTITAQEATAAKAPLSSW